MRWSGAGIILRAALSIRRLARHRFNFRCNFGVKLGRQTGTTSVADSVPSSTATAQHGRTTRMKIHDIVRELNAVLGSTLAAAL